MSGTGFGESAARIGGVVCRLLGWAPDDFWNCTPAELAAVLGVIELTPEVPDKATIDALRERFPDEDQERPANMKAAAPTMHTRAPR